MPPGAADRPAAAPYILRCRRHPGRGVGPGSPLSPRPGHPRRRGVLCSRGRSPLGSRSVSETEQRGDGARAGAGRPRAGTCLAWGRGARGRGPLRHCGSGSGVFSIPLRLEGFLCSSRAVKGKCFCTGERGGKDSDPSWKASPDSKPDEAERDPELLPLRCVAEMSSTFPRVVRVKGGRSAVGPRL